MTKPLRVKAQAGVATTTGMAIVMVIVVLATALVAQLAMVSHAQTTLSYAALMGARAGAVENADVQAIRRGVAAGLAPLFAAREQPVAGASGELSLPDLSALGFDRPGARRQQYETVFSWAPEEPALAPAMPDGTEAWAFATREFEAYGGMVILNPVREVFLDFGGQSGAGVDAIPSRGLWRRTGIPSGNASRQTTRYCTKTVIPAADNPSKPPEFEDFSPAEMSVIVDAFTWDTNSLKEETHNDYRKWGAGGPADLYKEPSKHKYVEEHSGPWGSALKQQLTSVIQQVGLDDPRRALREMETITGAKVSDTASRLASGQGLSTQYCHVTAATGYCDKNAKRKITRHPGDREYLGPVERFGELQQFLSVVNGSGSDELVHSVFQRMGQGFGQATAGRQYRNGSPSAQWNQFADGYRGVYEKEIEAAVAPQYSVFVSRVGQLASETLARAPGGSLTGNQRAYLVFLNMIANKVKSTHEEEEIREDCDNELVVASSLANTIGANGDQTIQDANLLRVLVVYGYKPFFDLPDSVYRLFGPQASGASADQRFPPELAGLVNKIRADGRQPMMAIGVVRMQTDPHLNEAMLSKNNRFFINSGQ